MITADLTGKTALVTGAPQASALRRSSSSRAAAPRWR